jgi:hypothetical protein
VIIRPRVQRIVQRVIETQRRGFVVVIIAPAFA